MSNEKMGRETWQEVLMRVLDTHISRHNAPNVPLELTLPYDAVVALKGLIEREYGGTEAQTEFGKGSETAFDGDRRLFEVKMTHNGRTVTISYDPSDPEAVKAAETWRKALFASGTKYTDKMASAMEPWTPVKTAEPKRDIMAIAGSAFELREASKPLLAYLDKYGCDEYTGVTVSRDAAIVGMNPSNGGVLFSTHFPRNGESIKRRLTKLQGGQFWCMLSKEAMDAWADIAREYGKLSNNQKDGTDSVSICADFVCAVRHLSDRLTRDLDEASKATYYGT